MRWSPIETAPTDGQLVLVSDGEVVWVSSKKEASFIPKDGMGPFDGHDWYLGERRSWPLWWMPLPKLPN